MKVETLSDLVFHIREISSGRPDLISLRLESRREILSTSELLRNVHSLALSLEDSGLAKGDRVAIYSENRPEWHTVDLACQLLGAPTVAIEPGSQSSRLAYLLRNSASRWIFYSDRGKRDQLLELRRGLTAPPITIAFDGDAAATPGGSLTHLLGAANERRGRVPLGHFRGRVGAEDPASISYPVRCEEEIRGTVLTHREMVGRLHERGESLRCGPRDLCLSLLPLSSAAQRTVEQLCFFRSAALAYLSAGVDPLTTFHELRPTILCAPAALLSRIHLALVTDGDAGEARRRLLRWSVEQPTRSSGGPGNGGGRLHTLRHQLAGLLVHRGMRGRLGGRLRAVVTDAPPPPAVDALFRRLRAPIQVALETLDPSLVASL